MTKPKEPTLTRSERHSINFCPKHGETGNEPCAICFPIESKFESCSEVVERLHKECMPWGWADLFDREKAEAILHSWRERRIQELLDSEKWLLEENRRLHRRVQELEELIAKHSGCSHCKDSAAGITSAKDPTETRRTR